jgi:transcriptional regulator with XRE-family HTH domain
VNALRTLRLVRGWSQEDFAALMDWMAYAIKRTFEVDPAATVSGGTVRAIQDEIAASSGVVEVSVRGDFTGDALVGLQVEVAVEASDSGRAGRLARQATRDAIRSVGLSERSFRVTSGSGREV